MAPRSAFSLVFLIVFLLGPPLLAMEREPNIIIILADDLGTGDLGMNGSPIRTPAIDRLAAEGAQLTNFYASANVCTPSRAGLLTGRYPIRMGLADKVVEADSTHGIPATETTLAELLRGRGYHNAIIGKWHLGHTEEFWPTRHGFDYYYGLPYSNDMEKLGLYRNDTLIEEPVEQSTLTRRYTDEAIKFISENREQPFFLYMAHTFPHIPLYASEKFRGKSAAGIYGDTVEELDWSVAEIMKSLEQHGLEKDTLVFFTSDNGAWFEGSNASFRDMKGLTWDGAYRVPLIARWPGKIPAGTVSDGIAMNIDILPTIATLLGYHSVQDKVLDGRNIWSLLQGAENSPHEYLYLFNNEDIAAVRMQDWKYMARAYYRTNYIGFDRIKEKMGFAYELLFDMRVDSPERYSQADKHPDIVKIMVSQLELGRKTFNPMRTKPAAKVFP